MFAFTLLAPSILQGQWEETNGPTIEKAFSLATATTNTGDTLLYVGSFGGVIFMSTNYGDNWTQIDGGNLSIGDTGFTQTSIEMLFAHSNTTGGIDLYASCPSGIFHTADYGTNWVKVDTLIDYPDYVVSHNTRGDTILFKIDNANCLTLSIDHGITWDKCLGSPPDIHTLQNCLAIHDSIVYIGMHWSYENRIYYSFDGGLKWNLGFYSNNELNAIAVCGPYLFVGIGTPFEFSKSVLRRPISQMLTRVDNLQENILQQYFLEQNYPNPFNLSTSIAFYLPTKSFVSLKVYDVLGKEVATLVNGMQEAGDQQVRFNTSQYPSGLYFYTLRTRNFLKPRRCCW